MNKKAITVELYEGDKILRKNSSDYLNNIIKLNENEQFIKIYVRAIDALVEQDLNGNEYKICIKLLQYIRYETGILTYSNGTMISTDDIVKITGLARTTVWRVLNNLINKKIFGKHKTGKTTCYTVNPYIFMRGLKINKTLHAMYKDSKWAKLYG